MGGPSFELGAFGSRGFGAASGNAHQQEGCHQSCPQRPSGPGLCEASLADLWPDDGDIAR